MATLDTTAFQDAMKTWYLAGIRDNTNRSTVLLDKLTRDEERVGGNFAYVSLLRRGNPGVGSRAEGGTLPTANTSKFQKATFGLKSQYGRFEVSGQATRQSVGDRAAFAEAVDTQIRSLMMDLPSEHNRMLFNDGTGALTVLTETTANTTKISVASTQYFKESDLVDVRNTTSGTAVTSGTDLSVDDVDEDNLIITVSTAITATDVHSFYRAGSRNQEIFGLEALVATANPTVGNFGNIDRTVTAGKFWQANIVGNSGTNRPFSSGLIQQGLSKSDIKGRGDPQLLVSDHDMWITYGNFLAPSRRFNDLIETLDGGWKMLPFNGLPWVADKDCLPNRVYILDLRAIFLFQHGDYEWMDLDGAILNRVLNKDVYEGTLLKDMQLGSDACNKQSVVTDLAVQLN